MILGGLAALMGVILIGFGSLAGKTTGTLPKEESEPRCPVCKGTIVGGCQVCQHCRTPLEWVGNKAMTLEEAEDARLEKARMDAAMREREERYKRQRYELDRQRQEAALVSMETSLASTMAWLRAVIRGIARFPRKCDALLRSLVGEENTILFHFVRCLILLASTVAVFALVWKLLFGR
jgi:hypothetical protein